MKDTGESGFVDIGATATGQKVYFQRSVCEPRYSPKCGDRVFVRYEVMQCGRRRGQYRAVAMKLAGDAYIARGAIVKVYGTFTRTQKCDFQH